MDNIFNVSSTMHFFLSKTETRSKSYSDPNVTHVTSSDEKPIRLKSDHEKPSHGLISGPPFSPRKKVDYFDTQNAEETDSGKSFLYSVVFLKV